MSDTSLAAQEPAFRRIGILARRELVWVVLFGAVVLLAAASPSSCPAPAVGK
jgi:hypothetical protein